MSKKAEANPPPSRQCSPHPQSRPATPSVDATGAYIEYIDTAQAFMFSFFKRKPAPEQRLPEEPPEATQPVAFEKVGSAKNSANPPGMPPTPKEASPRGHWMGRLRSGLQKTGSSLSSVFVGTRIDANLYAELEDALLMADAGVKATEFLLTELQRRVKEAKAKDPAQVKTLLAQTLAELLKPLEKPLVIGRHKTTVIMVAGVNGAGKTTSIGKLTQHLAAHGASVLLAAADTFRAAAKEQLGVWANRTLVDIISQQGSDPAAVAFDAVSAGKARGRDVVLVDTAGRLPTQTHLMDELKKIKRVLEKTGPIAAHPSTEDVSTEAESTPPHEVLLVIDGNTGQNALHQVRAFDAALGLTGLIVTKLDGTAKGGVIAAIAREHPIPVYFVGVGEKLEDLETFDAQEFAQALLN